MKAKRLPFLLMAISLSAQAGGDRTESLFAQAQNEALAIINPLRAEQIDGLEIGDTYKDWLKAPGRLARLQYYTGAMRLEYGEQACLRAYGEVRGVCFDDSDPARPRMLVSRDLNHETSPAQAIALVFHEAGHFVGEGDHTFLSGLGVALVEQYLNRPVVFPLSGTYTVPFSYFSFGSQKALEKTCFEQAFILAEKQCHQAGYAVCTRISANLTNTRYANTRRLVDERVSLDCSVAVQGRKR